MVNLLRKRVQEDRIQTIRSPHVRTVLLSTVIAALVATVGVALQREISAKFARAPEAAPSATHEEKALNAEEENYALALWPIHHDVTLAAVTMSFAGIGYKLEDHDLRRLEAKVQPLIAAFRKASERAAALSAPGSLRKVHEQYLEALTLYENASSEMVKTAADGSDAHLIEAQRMSLHAAENLLRVGDVLWPGEHKPN